MSYNKKPSLNRQSRTAFMYIYYERCRRNDNRFVEAMRRMLIINQKFMDSFFKKSEDSSNQGNIFAYVNIGKQKIELKTDWNENGIYTGLMGAPSNLLLLKLATFTSIQLCIIAFDEFNSKLTHFWIQFCQILKEKKALESIELHSYSMPSSFILDNLPDKITSLQTDNLNYPLHRRKAIMDNLCLFSYSDMPNYNRLLQIRSKNIEIQRSGALLSGFYELHGCFPFQANSCLQKLVINVDFELPMYNRHFELLNELWANKCARVYSNVFAELKKVNPKIVVEVPEYNLLCNNLKCYDDAILAHHSFLHNVESFINMADGIKVEIPLLKTFNSVFEENFHDSFIHDLGNELGMQVSNSEIGGEFVYKETKFMLVHSYLPAPTVT